jgi:signal transduction histidine kinase
MARLGRWWRRTGHRLASPETALLPKILAAFVAVLALASLLTFLLETRLTREVLHEQAVLLTSEQGNALDTRVREDSSRIHLLMSAIAQQHLTGVEPADRPLGRRLIDVLGTLRAGDSQLEVASVLDLESGQVLQSLPGRHAIAPPGEGPPEADQYATRGVQRVVPLADGGYALVYTLPVGRLEGRALLLVAGYPLDHSRASGLAALTGVDEVQIVVDERIVASSSSEQEVGERTLGSPRRQRETQELPDDRLARYVSIGVDHDWGHSASIALILDDPLATLDSGLARTRALMVALLMGIGGALAFVLARVMTRPILELTETATAIARGDLDRSFEVDRHDEIGTLADALERMRRALRAQLLVIRRQAEALQEAARRIVSTQDTERRRVAQDLHDGIQQQLVVLRMQVGSARTKLAEDPSRVDELAEEVATSVDAILDQLRSTGQSLFPSILRDLGLGGALFSLAGRAEVPLDVRLDPDPLPRVDEAVETNAYFLVSEAVTNALKHADAARIRVEVTHEGDVLRVRIGDDGRGFDPAQPGHTGGVVHMRDRVNALGGSLQVLSGPGEGTAVTAVFPLDRAPKTEPTAVDHPPVPPRGRPDGAVSSVGGPLEVEEDGRDPAVELEILREPELAEDRVGMLLDRPVRDRQLPGDGRVPPS